MIGACKERKERKKEGNADANYRKNSSDAHRREWNDLSGLQKR